MMFRQMMATATGLALDGKARITYAAALDGGTPAGQGGSGQASATDGAGADVGTELDAMAAQIAAVAKAQSRFAAKTAGSTAIINSSSKLGQAAQGAGR